MTEDEIVGWHHQLLEHAPGVGDGMGVSMGSQRVRYD